MPRSSSPNTATATSAESSPAATGVAGPCSSSGLSCTGSSVDDDEFLDASIESVMRSSRTPSEFSLDAELDDLPEPAGNEHIVFVPGFKGSELVDAKSGKLVWIHARDVIPLVHPPQVSLPLRYRPYAEAAAGGFEEGTPSSCERTALSTIDVVQDRDDLVVRGPLQSVAKGLHQVYGRLCARGQRKWGSRFHVFAYDWRRDNVESALRLTDFMADLCATGEVPRVTLLAHSMGGLLVWGVLSYLARGHAAGTLTARERALVALLCRSRVIFGSTPFKPLNCLMEDFTPGTKMHRAYLPCEVLATMPAAWQLMMDGSEEAALRNPDWWQQRRVGMFVWDMPPDRARYYKQLLRTQIARALAFRRDMLLPSFRNTPFEGLPVAVIASRSRKTPLSFPEHFFDSSRPVSWAHGDDLLPGDSRTAYINAVSVPEGLELQGVALTGSIHRLVFDDERALRTAFDMFKDAPSPPPLPTSPLTPRAG